MKKLILVLILIVTGSISAQDYKSWAVEAGVGNHYIADQSATLGDNQLSFNLTVRKNLSRTFGLGFYGGYDKLDLVTFDGVSTTSKYFRGTLEGVIDVSNILEIENEVFTLLTHGGVGSARVTGGVYQEVSYNLVLAGGATALFKLGEGFALKVDWTTLVNGNQKRTLDGAFDVTNAQVNSIVNNFTLGAVFYIGKADKHADWVQTPKPVYTNTYITNEGAVTNTFVSEVIECKCSADENVYFENDEDIIRIQGLNAIEKIANLLIADNEATVHLTGSESPTINPLIDDKDLSERRVSAIESKLVALGISPHRIFTTYIGKDANRDLIHEFARKVSLIVK